jgi:hypothetical protein
MVGYPIPSRKCDLRITKSKVGDRKVESELKSLFTFLDFLGHILANFMLVCAEGDGIAVEHPRRVALKGLFARLASQVVKYPHSHQAEITKSGCSDPSTRRRMASFCSCILHVAGERGFHATSGELYGAL